LQVPPATLLRKDAENHERTPKLHHIREAYFLDNETRSLVRTQSWIYRTSNRKYSTAVQKLLHLPRFHEVEPRIITQRN